MLGCCAATPAVAVEDSIVAAVYARVPDGDQRQKAADGSSKREAYAQVDLGELKTLGVGYGSAAEPAKK
jgi:hypothetical protein